MSPRTGLLLHCVLSLVTGSARPGALLVFPVGVPGIRYLGTVLIPILPDHKALAMGADVEPAGMERADGSREDLRLWDVLQLRQLCRHPLDQGIGRAHDGRRHEEGQ